MGQEAQDLTATANRLTRIANELLEIVLELRAAQGEGGAEPHPDESGEKKSPPKLNPRDDGEGRAEQIVGDG